MILPETQPAAFPEEIVRRHFPAAWLAAAFSNLSETFSDEELRKTIPHPRRPEMAERILGFLEEIRALGVLKPMTAGPDRGIREAVDWNRFVTGGREAVPHGLHALMRTPLPKAIWSAMYNTAQDVLRGKRKGLDLEWGKPFTLSQSDISGLPQAAENAIALVASGQRVILTIDNVTCPKTDAHLSWEPDQLFAPVLGQYWANGTYERLAAFDAPKPLRHLEITLPSGILLAADWFRIPGFTEAVEDEDDSRPSINSDLGIDLRTRDHFERLGLMRIHTTNCVPAFVQDGDAVRVGHFNDEDDAFYTEEGDRNEVPLPEVVGRVCCDLWDVTFADRDVLITLLEKGGQFPDREAAVAALDDYTSEGSGDVARLDFPPGTTLHIYMATGGDVSVFADKFRSEDISDWPCMKDMFVLSTRPLSVDPDLVEEVDWVFPALPHPTEDCPSL